MVINNHRPARVVAVFGSLANRVPHVTETALVHEIDDQLELVKDLEIGRFRLIPRLDHHVECCLHELANAATENGLLAEQIGLGLFSKRRFQNSGPATTDALAVRGSHVMGITGRVLMDSDQARHAKAPFEHDAHPVTRGFRGDHYDVDALGRDDLFIEDREAVGKQQGHARFEVRFDIFTVDLRLGCVGQAERNQVGPLDGLCVGQYFEPGFLGLLLAAAAFVQTDDDVEAAVLQVQRMGVALRSVTQYCYRPVAQYRVVDIFVVEESSHVWVSASGSWIRFLPAVPAAWFLNVVRRPRIHLSGWAVCRSICSRPIGTGRLLRPRSGSRAAWRPGRCE